MENTQPLIEQAADPLTLMEAWRRIQIKGARGGIDNISIDQFENDAQIHLDNLRKEILQERYAPLPVKQINIPKDSNPGETRPIGLASIRDKIVQEAVRSTIEPIFDRQFLDCSYGYRRRKGAQRAVCRVSHHLSSFKHRWIVSGDIDDFFGSLDHQILLDRLTACALDESILRLIRLWIKMGTIDTHGRWHDVVSGVVQGSVISPMLANVYLHPFDEALTHHKLGLVRYADDFVITTADHAQAEEALAFATNFLENNLSLRLNPNPIPIASKEEGFSFLGIHFHGDRRIISDDKLQSIRSKVQSIVASNGQDFTCALNAMNESCAGWKNYYGTLISRDSILKIDAIHKEGCARLIERGFKTGVFHTLAEAQNALQKIEIIRDRALSNDERRLWISEIVRQGKLLAAQHPNGSDSDKIKKLNAATLADSVGTAAKAGEQKKEEMDRIQPASGASVAAVVRSQKRRYVQETARISELVLSAPGSFLGKTKKRIIVRKDRQNVCDIPAFRLSGITITSRGISLSADVIEQCVDEDIPLLFTTPQGKLIGVLSAPQSSSGATGLLQIEALHDGSSAFEIARLFVKGKIINQANLIKYMGKYMKQSHSEFDCLCRKYVDEIQKLLEEAMALKYAGDLPHTRNQLMGIEGRAAERYWNVFKEILKSHVEFPGRLHRGAKDLVNSLLNYGYAVLQRNVYLAIIRAGLNAQISFLHSLQGNEPTLAFDLMEEFRPQVVDRTVLAALGRREKLEIGKDGMLTEETRSKLIANIRQRLATIIQFRKSEMKLGDIIDSQARALVKHLKNEKKYRPFIAKW